MDLDSNQKDIKVEVEDLIIEHRPESEEINPMSAEDCEAFIKAKMEEGENEHDDLPENSDERCEVFIKEEIEVKAEPDFLADSSVSGAEEFFNQTVVSSPHPLLPSSEGTDPLLR
jgi:hypothetical protein